jgi:uncharacterized membrane protein
MDLKSIFEVIGIACLPIFELRGAIPYAISLLDFPWYYAYLFGVIGNILPVAFILLFLDAIIPILCKVNFLRRIFDWFLTRTRRRGKIVERYERIGLALFVAIPLPITGAWTGAILAVILGIRFKYAFLSIIAGVLVAGIIVTCTTVLGWAIADVVTTPVK